MRTFTNIILLILVIALIAVPMFLVKGEFSGADELASRVIEKQDPNYKPWFSPVWEPPSGEIESFLFALQAALGAGFVGFYLGYLKGKKEGKNVNGTVGLSKSAKEN
ncbi:energy-coupling factor ABC transporter substrate-binding protein [Carboxydothermus pertinax]|uniref:Cobalt transport protein CbiN n=1 Tax=Carboxydothermus pertinax TaxID=870242 RepID=A0A1L8CSU9_9THEO|nr:energy-coupling factor ABC transporter substrate-binding protein [Carboxydothermus pertinax]GAV21998.1 cobalt ABC transporter substrate-binding protein CbiN [Carboxydothermus pertinax]